MGTPNLGFLTIVLVSLFLKVTVVGGKGQACQLVWKSTSFESLIPDDAVPTFQKDFFIARKISNYNNLIGYVQNLTHFRVAYTYNLEQFENTPHLYYDVLTNPNDCFVDWVTPEAGEVRDPHLRFETSAPIFYPKQYLVRAESDNLEKIQVGGYFQDDTDDMIYFPGIDGKSKKNAAHGGQFLLSSMNLRLEMRNFKFSEIVDDGDADVFGMDVIINDSAAEVNQTVMHRKMVMQRTSFEQSDSFSEVTQWKVGLMIPLKGATLNLGFEWGNEDGSTDASSVMHAEEKEVLSQRTIIVPPFTSLEACSFSSFKDKAELPYKAEGVYTVKGSSASDVLAIMKNANIGNIIGIEGNAVIAEIESKLYISVPTKTSFSISAIGDPNGCRAISKKLSHNRRRQIFGTQ